MTKTNATFQPVNTQNNSENILGNYQKALYEYNTLRVSFNEVKAEKEKMAAAVKTTGGTKQAADLDTYKEVNDRFLIAEATLNKANANCHEAGEKVKQLLHDFPDTSFEFSVKRKGVGGLEVSDIFSIMLIHGELSLQPLQKNAN